MDVSPCCARTRGRRCKYAKEIGNTGAQRNQRVHIGTTISACLKAFIKKLLPNTKSTGVVNTSI
ncbi:hypothetical protein ACFOG5_24670 [Pedobacter fastidiosus]|uniref:hypothetical protein n=1 Tax=Pedobacter fastidiosus TaxID=2765361 RepID=UPI00360F619D